MAQTANLYFGATGWTVLNRAGDRKYGDYDFWALRQDTHGVLQWVNVCRYDTTSGLGETLTCPDQLRRSTGMIVSDRDGVLVKKNAGLLSPNKGQPLTVIGY